MTDEERWVGWGGPVAAAFRARAEEDVRKMYARGEISLNECRRILGLPPLPPSEHFDLPPVHETVCSATRGPYR